MSGLWSSSGGEFGLLQEDRQGRQASHYVVRGYSVFHWSQCRGIRTYLEQRGDSASFFLAAGSTGFHLRFNGCHRPSLVVQGEVGIPLELKLRMGPHLQMRWDTRGSCRIGAGNWAFILSCDRDLWAPLSCMRESSPLWSFEKELGIALEALQEKKASTRVDGAISWFVSN